MTNFPKMPSSQNKTLSYGTGGNLLPRMQILRYMGNKKSLLNWLIPMLSKQLKTREIILDLFAGTSSVGYALKQRNKIIANDIQEYSTIISKALLQHNKILNENYLKKQLLYFYNKNRNYLLRKFSNAIKDEAKSIKEKNISRYKLFLSDFPLFGYSLKNDKYGVNSFFSEHYLNRKRQSPESFPFILFTIYYSNTFFSLEQCIDIDSLRYAISKIKNASEQAVKDLYTDFYSLKGYILEKLRRYDDAELVYNTALSFNPNKYYIYASLADLRKHYSF